MVQSVWSTERERERERERDPGPHLIGDGDFDFGPHRHGQVNEEQSGGGAFVVGPQVAVILDHLTEDGIRHSLSPHMFLQQP